MVRPQYNYTSLIEFYNFLYTAVNYLEKATKSDLGDFTKEGKTRNAGYNNYTVYWQWYKELGYKDLQGEPYCAGAVSTMMVSAFGLAKAKKLLCGDLYTYCPTGYSQFKKKNRIFSKPQPFDIIFFYSDSMGRYSHTGIVLGVDSNGNGYTTWEANTSSGNDVVVRNGGATCIKHYTLGARKVAFGRPDWAGNGITAMPAPKPQPNPDTMPDVPVYKIAVGVDGLRCTVDSILNVRKVPGTGSVVNSIKKNEVVAPSKKCFIDGAPWYYIESKGGWASAKYFTGWVKEANDRWWYLLPGYTYHTNSIEEIDGKVYYFDAAGYMFVGTITLKTDDSGALKLESAEPEG